MSLTVAHFPDIDRLAENPYWTILRTALEQEGVQNRSSRSEVFGRRWLWRNRRLIQVLHFHYVQKFYAFEGTQARLRWVLRFASNLLLARLLGYRTVFTLHNATPTYPLQPEWVDHVAHWVAVNLTDSVIVHCDAASQLLKEKFGRTQKVYLVPHPHFIGHYPNDIAQTDARIALGIEPDSLMFVFIGGIRPNKGLENLIAAFKQLTGEDMRLVIAGKSWPPEEYIQMLEASTKQDSRIVFHKRFIPDEDLQIYFNAADVVVLPFARILTSSSVILAMSFARPIVAPALGCLPELITKDIGILYDQSSPSGLLQALTRCRELRPELHQMGVQAQATAQKFTGQSMAEMTLRAYRMEN